MQWTRSAPTSRRFWRDLKADSRSGDPSVGLCLGTDFSLKGIGPFRSMDTCLLRYRLINGQRFKTEIPDQVRDLGYLGALTPRPRDQFGSFHHP